MREIHATYAAFFCAHPQLAVIARCGTRIFPRTFRVCGRPGVCRCLVGLLRGISVPRDMACCGYPGRRGRCPIPAGCEAGSAGVEFGHAVFADAEFDRGGRADGAPGFDRLPGSVVPHGRSANALPAIPDPARPGPSRIAGDRVGRTSAGLAPAPSTVGSALSVGQPLSQP